MMMANVSREAGSHKGPCPASPDQNVGQAQIVLIFPMIQTMFPHENRAIVLYGT